MRPRRVDGVDGRGVPAVSVLRVRLPRSVDDAARQRAADAGVADRVTFTRAAADEYGEARFDLVCFFDPIGRMFYAASTFICTSNSLSQDVGLALGAQAGERRLRDVFTEAGFTSFRRATETPFNLVLEARN